ncbi:WS/DGAT domain-containing protein [Hoyosella subflava]|uniref:WS/DGAT domain-containing protein n=1 Tax=Hoyosella subflava TaxID=639313 RepID=UPI0011D2A66C
MVTVATSFRSYPEFGNNFTMAIVPFCTTVANSRERLARVAASTKRMKQRVRNGPKVPTERVFQPVRPMFIPKLLGKGPGEVQPMPRW